MKIILNQNISVCVNNSLSFLLIILENFNLNIRFFDVI